MEGLEPADRRKRTMNRLTTERLGEILLKARLPGDEQIELARLYAEGIGVERDMRQAVQWYEPTRSIRIPRELCFTRHGHSPDRGECQRLWMTKVATPHTSSGVSSLISRSG